MAGDPEVLAWLETLPERKQQPNLVFAAARWHGVPAPGPYAGLRAALLGDDGADPGHDPRAGDADQRGRPAGHACTRPSPALGTPAAGAARGRRERRAVPVPRPLRLPLDVPGRRRRSETDPGGPLLRVRDDRRRRRGRAAAGRRGAAASTSHPSTSPTTRPCDGWRRWSGRSRTSGASGCAAAVGIARADPPYLVRGDLLDALPALVEQAPPDATVVVFHSRRDRLPRARRPGAVRGDDDGPGRRRPLPLGQQRGAAGAARPGTARGRRPVRPRSCWASTAGRSPGPTATGPSSTGSDLSARAARPAPRRCGGARRPRSRPRSPTGPGPAPAG